jgi:4-hydroxy-tetrahydrodipicolinate synthase
MNKVTQAQQFRGVRDSTHALQASGAIDEVSLQNCVEFCVEGGAGGIVAPVNASESIVLTDEERLRVAEILVSQAAGRIPVVIGVSGVSTQSSALYARHAAKVGADSVIAMPPYVRHPPAEEIYDFYAAVAAAADGLPVWIQDYVGPVGTPMSVGLLNRLLDIPGVSWLKEEPVRAPGHDRGQAGGRGQSEGHDGRDGRALHGRGVSPRGLRDDAGLRSG